MLQEVGLQPALEEQQHVLREQGAEINQEVLNTMDVLHRNITEALRINPPLIMLMRQVKKSFAVTTSTGKTYIVPKVCCCSISTMWLSVRASMTTIQSRLCTYTGSFERELCC